VANNWIPNVSDVFINIDNLDQNIDVTKQ